MSDPLTARYRADEALRLGIITPAEHAYFITKTALESETIIETAAGNGTQTTSTSIVASMTQQGPVVAPIAQPSTPPTAQATTQSTAQQITVPTAQPDEAPPVPPERFRAHKDQTSNSRVIGLLLVTSVIPIIMIIAALFWMPSDITGNVVLIPQHPLVNEGIPLTDAVTGLHVSGVLHGEGSATIAFVTPTTTYLLGNVSADTGAPRTDKPAYHAGDNVFVQHAPATFTAYFDDGATSNAIDVPFNASVGGTLLLVTNESGNLNTYRLPIIIGDAERTTTFTALCGEACSIDPTNGTIVVSATDGNVTFTAIETNAVEHLPPTLIAPFAPVTVNETTTLNLSTHFADPQGGVLTYAVVGATKVNAIIAGDTLTLTPIADGTESIIIYASNLGNFTAESVAVTAIAPVAPSNTTTDANASIGNATIAPLNGTIALNDTNATIDLGNMTNVTTDNVTIVNNTNLTIAGLDCNNPDPNLRPIDCLNSNATKYFEEDIYLENDGRATVGKVTEIGNLLITGGVLHDTTGVAGAGDFNVGYKDADFNYIKTIWIDAAGNLHLRGQLYEENNNLVPPQGSYAISNRRGIYLLYANQETGDLFVRGNVIPYRANLR